MSRLFGVIALVILSIAPAYPSEFWVTYRVPAKQIYKFYNRGFFTPRPTIRYTGPTAERERRAIVPDTPELRAFFRYLMWTWKQVEISATAQDYDKWIQFSVRSDGRIPASSIQWLTDEEAQLRNAMPMSDLDYEKLGDALKNLGLDPSVFDAEGFDTMVDVRAERVGRRFGENLSERERAERARRLEQMPPEAQRVFRAEGLFGRRSVRDKIRR